MPTLERKNAQVCSLRFRSDNFKVFSANVKRLNEHAVPDRTLSNWDLHQQPNLECSFERSFLFNSPVELMDKSSLTPLSPHINKNSIKKHYGCKSRKQLFTSTCSTSLQSDNELETFAVAVPEYPSDITYEKRKRESEEACPIETARKRPAPEDASSQEQNDSSINEVSPVGGTQSSKRNSSNDSRILKLKEKLDKKNRLIRKLRMQVARSKKPKHPSLTMKDFVTSTKAHLRPSLRILLEAQLQLNACKKKSGMRWSREMKDFTLGLLYHGPRCYRYLSKLIPLPSLSTIKRHQSQIPVKPGIHATVRKFLLEQVGKWSTNKKICVLVIDELSIASHFEYNIKSDMVTGFCDDGTIRTNQAADQGLLVALKGILCPWKQVVGHYFTNSKDKAEGILKAVRECVALANEVGLILKVVCCDQGSKNRKVCRQLGVTSKKPYFMNGKEKVYFLWDPPHLIKSLRNNLLNYDFMWRGHKVSWKYIKALYFAQLKMRLKLTPKIKRRHIIFRSSFAKMKVKLATQVFSNAVYKALLTFIAFNRFPNAAIHTANCSKDINDLFDCFNSMQFVKGRFSLRYAISKTSEHIPFLDPKILGYFEEAYFVGATRQPYCLDGWVLSIRSLLSLVEDLSDNYGVKSVRTRMMNQDFLENTFSTVRQQHGCSDNPTPGQLERGLRMTTISSLAKISDSGNCEDEMEEAVLTLSKLPKTVVTPKPSEAEVAATMSDLLEDLENFDFNAEMDAVEESALYHCCGFVTRNYARKHKDCPLCEFKLLVDPDERMLTESYQMFTYFKAHSAQLGEDFGHLKAPSFESFQTLKKIDNLFHEIFSKRAHEVNIATKIQLAIETEGLSLDLCTKEADDLFLTMYVKTRILWEVRFMNSRFEEARAEKAHQRKLKKLQGKDAASSKKGVASKGKEGAQDAVMQPGEWSVNDAPKEAGKQKGAAMPQEKGMGVWQVRNNT